MNPFPGIRPFEEVEFEVYFGRDESVGAILHRLSACRFLAITGPSGSGKSSLVRAGLIPALKGGSLSAAGSRWKTAVFRPDTRPLHSLAAALAQLAGTSPEEQEDILRQSSWGLVDAVKRMTEPSGGSVLLCVDQFEELFRCRDEDEKAFFVRLLMEAAVFQGLPIYVVISLRSEFLGECAVFRDLPEALNNGLYLVPRMTRGELRLAIEGPAEIAGASISPYLLDNLLNDLAMCQDYLVLMQHALCRAWEEWQQASENGRCIDLSDFEKVGGLSSIGAHAEDTLHSLSPEQQQIARLIFQCMTASAGRDDEFFIRVPVTFHELCQATGNSEETIRCVVDTFRRSGLLLPQPGHPMMDDTVCDLTHESIIWKWPRLQEWAKDEAQFGSMYVRLADWSREAFRVKAASRDDLLRGHLLEKALRWLHDSRANEHWTSRYGCEFFAIGRLIEESRKARLSVFSWFRSESP